LSGGKRKTERGDARGGGFFLLPHCLLASEAFRTASPRAVKVLLALCAKHNGFNNGMIGMGFRELAEAMDSQNHGANGKALCQLMERGLVALERSYPKGQRLANEYRLTFVAMADAPATNDYLNWKPGDAGTRKKARGNFRAAETSTRSAVRVAIASTGEEISRCENLNGGHENPPFFGSSPVAIASTHIVQPYEGLSASPSKSPQHTGGPLSAAPDPERLRERVLSTLDSAARGSQGQLAALASIRPAALSKFLSGGGSLNDQARIRLTLALPKIAYRDGSGADAALAARYMDRQTIAACIWPAQQNRGG
jgi:hypothetical protein